MKSEGLGVREALSLFRETLEATGSGTLHFSCRTCAGSLACSQTVGRLRRMWRGEMCGLGEHSGWKPFTQPTAFRLLRLKRRPPERLGLLSKNHNVIFNLQAVSSILAIFYPLKVILSSKDLASLLTIHIV